MRLITRKSECKKSSKVNTAAFGQPQYINITGQKNCEPNHYITVKTLQAPLSVNEEKRLSGVCIIPDFSKN